MRYLITPYIDFCNLILYITVSVCLRDGNTLCVRVVIQSSFFYAVCINDCNINSVIDEGIVFKFKVCSRTYYPRL